MAVKNNIQYKCINAYCKDINPPGKKYFLLEVQTFKNLNVYVSKPNDGLYFIVTILYFTAELSFDEAVKE